MLWIYSIFEPQQYDTIGYSRKILQTIIFFFIFSIRRTVVHLRYLRGHLQICPVRYLLFRPTIKIKGSLLKKQAN